MMMLMIMFMIMMCMMIRMCAFDVYDGDAVYEDYDNLVYIEI